MLSQTNTEVLFCTFDNHGNVAERLNGSADVLSVDICDAYGQRTSHTTDPLGYRGAFGYYTGAETGLQLLGQRFYNPAAGRFLTRDPIGYAGGTNLYSYCRNNPVSGADPSGTSDPFTGMFMGYMRFCLQMGNPLGNPDYTRAVNIMFPPDPCDGFNYDAPWVVASLLTPEGFEANAGRAVEAVNESEEVANVVKLCENGGCFVAGTLVQMADGKTKPIEKVEVGDRVMSRDEKTGKTEVKTVTNTIVHEQVPTIALHFKNSETIVTTDVHPFYVAGMGFVKAGDLAIGNAVVTRAGPVNKITQIEHKSPATVYNLTVDDTHTYFVGSRDGGVWVHNSDICNKYLRAKFRKGVRDKVWQQAENDSRDGIVRDYVTDEPIDPNGPWDMGHKPGWEHAKHVPSAQRRNLTREQFLNEYNDPSHYRPELPMSNQGHAGEGPKDLNFWP